jgi:hypothetical protein
VRIAMPTRTPRRPLRTSALLRDGERPLQAELATVERFASLMAGEGWPAHVAAIVFDRIYARERFIFARRHGGPELAALAMHLLYCHRYGRAGWVPPG